MDNLARVHNELPLRWGGSVYCIPHIVDALESKGYFATDFYFTADNRYFLFVDKLAAPIRSDDLNITRMVVEDLPMNFETGDICTYRSISRGNVEVEFVEHNDVDDWPIKTAQVKLPAGPNGVQRVDSVRIDQLRATGRRVIVEEAARPQLVFGGRERA